MLGGKTVTAGHDYHGEIPAKPADCVIDGVEVADGPAAAMDIVQRAGRRGRRTVNPKRDLGGAGFDLPVFYRCNVYAAARSDDHRYHRGRLRTKRGVVDGTRRNGRQLVDKLLQYGVERHENLRQ